MTWSKSSIPHLPSSSVLVCLHTGDRLTPQMVDNQDQCIKLWHLMKNATLIFWWQICHLLSHALLWSSRLCHHSTVHYPVVFKTRFHTIMKSTVSNTDSTFGLANGWATKKSAQGVGNQVLSTTTEGMMSKLQSQTVCNILFTWPQCSKNTLTLCEFHGTCMFCTNGSVDQWSLCLSSLMAVIGLASPSANCYLLCSTCIT